MKQTVDYHKFIRGKKGDDVLGDKLEFDTLKVFVAGLGNGIALQARKGFPYQMFQLSVTVDQLIETEWLNYHDMVHFIEGIKFSRRVTR